MIEKMKTWFRQHFCMHEWVSDGDLSRFSVREDDGVIYEC